MNDDIIRKHLLFSDLSDEDYGRALIFFHAYAKSHMKGEYLNRIGATLDAFGLVLSGNVQVYMVDIDGNEMIMANVSQGESFGESLCFLQRETPVYIRAVSDCEILWLDPDRIKSAANNSPFDIELASRFTALLAQRTLSMNNRIQILSKLTLRRKLITFFSEYAVSGAAEFTVPMNRHEMAAYLGAERSALSRELSKMRSEGIIDFNRNRFRILTDFSK